jgi:hypothetical protein
MRFRLIPVIAVLAVLALAETASARPIAQVHAPSTTQNLQSPDAQDANAAKDAQTLQDLAHLHAGGRIHTSSLAGTYTQRDDPALVQEQYYSSYGKTAPVHRAVPADDDTPWDAIAAGIALIAIVATAVGIAVRTRRRVHVAV